MPQIAQDLRCFLGIMAPTAKHVGLEEAKTGEESSGKTISLM